MFCRYLPLAGLFWAGISQSAASLVPWAFHPPEEIRKMVPVLALYSGCPEDSVGLVECLRAKPVAEILILYDTQYKVSVWKTYQDILWRIFQLGPLLILFYFIVVQTTGHSKGRSS